VKKTRQPSPRVHLNRALSKLGILTRSRATAAILEGLVSVDGRVVRDPAARVDPERSTFTVNDRRTSPAPWRTILLNKPRGVVTTRHDPEQRKTVYDVLGEDEALLVPVGRLDLATSGLLLLTSDTYLADWITDPAHHVARVYIVTVRGTVTEEERLRLEAGLSDGRGELRASSVVIRKASGRESHLTIELREGKNREVRRLCEAIGHEVTRLKRIRLGGLELGDLAPGRWRELTVDDVHAAFPASETRTAQPAD
jgi:23S rRNA pseudouridine2605 synthase